MQAKRLTPFIWLFLLSSIFFGGLLESAESQDLFKEPLAPNSSDAASQTDSKELKQTQTILRASPEKSSIFSQPVSFVANVISSRISSSIPQGTIRFEIDHQIVDTQPLTNGTAKLTLSTLSVASLTPHHVVAVYSGDEIYAGSKDAFNFSVLPANTSLSLKSWPNPSVFGESVKFTVDVRSLAPATAIPNGSVKFQIDKNRIENVDLDPQGRAIFSSSEIPGGQHSVTVIYEGNENFNGSSIDLTQQVNKTRSTAQISSSLNPSIFGQPTVFTVKVSSDAGKPTGEVQFIVNGVQYGRPVQLNSQGEASITIRDWTSGNHDVEAHYLGDGHFNPSNAVLNQQVNPISTKAEIISSANPSMYGQSVGITAKITSENQFPVGYAQFKVDGKVYGNSQLLPRNGEVTMNVSQLKTGAHQIEVQYLGSENFQPSSALLVQQIEKAKTTGLTSSENPSVYGKPVSITATVTAEELIPTGLVQFKLDGENFGRALVLSQTGQASINLNRLTAGSHEIQADYLGSENFSPSSAKLNQEVEKARTKTFIASSENPSVYGNLLKAVATVTSGELMPTGSVQFKVNGENVGAPQPVLRNGQATVNLPKLQAGSHDIEAEYLGNENFHSSYHTLSQFINKANVQLFVTSSATPSVLGDPVTLTATLSTNETLKGTVQFQIDGINVGEPVEVNEKHQASLSLSNELKVGGQDIVAVYSGDDNFNSAISPPFLQFAALALMPPSDVEGVQVVNRVGDEEQSINILRWKAPTSGTQPKAYHIYYDSELKRLIATIPADRALEFIDLVKVKEPVYQYFIVSVDALGNQSKPASIKIDQVVEKEKQKSEKDQKNIKAKDTRDVKNRE